MASSAGVEGVVQPARERETEPRRARHGHDTALGQWLVSPRNDTPVTIAQSGPNRGIVQPNTLFMAVDVQSRVRVQFTTSDDGTRTDGSITVIQNIPCGGNRAVQTGIAYSFLLNTGDRTQDVPLQAGDMVFVPRKGIANVNLWIDQYVKQVLPFSTAAGFSGNFDWRTNGTSQP